MGPTIPAPIINNAESTNSIVLPPDNICVKIAFPPAIIQVWKRYMVIDITPIRLKPSDTGPVERESQAETENTIKLPVMPNTSKRSVATTPDGMLS